MEFLGNPMSLTGRLIQNSLNLHLLLYKNKSLIRTEYIRTKYFLALMYVYVICRVSNTFRNFVRQIQKRNYFKEEFPYNLFSTFLPFQR